MERVPIVCDRIKRAFAPPVQVPKAREPPRERVLDMTTLLQPGTVSDQSQSLFFALLPPEIRFAIYAMVLPQKRRVWVRPCPLSGTLHVEHFPCRKPPTDLSWLNAPNTSACCTPVSTGFFGCVEARRLLPHLDSLALMKTCRKMYLGSIIHAIPVSDKSNNGARNLGL